MDLTDETFQTEVIESPIPVLVDFWAEWCAPCKMVAPIVDELALEFDGQLKVGKVNVDIAQKIAGEFGIRSIPTLLLFKQGKLTDQIIGAHDKKHLEDKIKAIL